MEFLGQTRKYNRRSAAEFVQRNLPSDVLDYYYKSESAHMKSGLHTVMGWRDSVVQPKKRASNARRWGFILASRMSRFGATETNEDYVDLDHERLAKKVLNELSPQLIEKGIFD